MRRLVSAVVLAASLALPAPASADVIVHDWTGVVTSIYDGMTGAPISFPEFSVGDAFTGCFSYDTTSIDQFPAPDLGRYASATHQWSITLPAGTIVGSEVSSDVALFPWAESVSATAGQANLPAGWSSPSSVSDSFSVILQNAPSLGVLTTDALPASIDLSDWVSYREMRLDFYDGLTTPLGTTTQRLIVQGEITSISLAGPGGGCGGSGDPLGTACPSSGPWESHGDYVSCVAQASQDLVRSGSMTREARQAVLKAAAQSEIGK